MAFQFYLTADPSPYEPLVWLGTWDDTTQAVTRRLDSTKTTADPAAFLIQSAAGIEIAPLNAKIALLRYVSGPILAQTISGTMQIRVGVVASDPAAELYFACHAWVTTGDTDIPRGVLINNFEELQITGNPWPDQPRGRDLILSAAINALQIRDNDRIVIELGYIARNTTTTLTYGAMYYGTDYYSNGSPDMVRDP